MLVAVTIFFALFSFVSSDNCSNVTCPIVPKHYEEIGCKPIIPSGECCPQSFDCTDFYSRDRSKCYHKGKAFNPGQKIEHPELDASCDALCTCDEDGYADCSHIDCPEFFGSRRSPGSKCIAQYAEYGCCKERDVCDDDLKSLAKCIFQNETYYEGQVIYPKEPCYKCLCTKDFEDKPAPVNKHCRKINCHIDLLYGYRLNRGCVPIYHHTEDCCPIRMYCPENDSSVIKSKTSIATPDSPECTFGNLKLAIGDVLSPKTPNKCNVCTCKHPPFITCIKPCGYFD